jgi:hypothetical protein
VLLLPCILAGVPKVHLLVALPLEGHICWCYHQRCVADLPHDGCWHRVSGPGRVFNVRESLTLNPSCTFSALGWVLATVIRWLLSTYEAARNGQPRIPLMFCSRVFIDGHMHRTWHAFLLPSSASVLPLGCCATSWACHMSSAAPDTGAHARIVHSVT